MKLTPEKHITGYFFRVKRNGEWLSIDIACMTGPEIAETFADAPKEKVVRVVQALAAWIGGNHVE